jgi:hypothetical protein
MISNIAFSSSITKIWYMASPNLLVGGEHYPLLGVAALN